MLIYQRMPGLNLLLIYMYYGNTFDYISWSPETKVCLLLQHNSAVHSQKIVLSTLQVSRYCLLEFQGKNFTPCNLNSLDLFHDAYVCSGLFKGLLQWRPNVGGTVLKNYNHYAYWDMAADMQYL